MASIEIESFSLDDFGVSPFCPYREQIQDRLNNLHPAGYEFENEVRFLEDFATRTNSGEGCQFIKDGKCSLASFAIERAPLA